MNPQWLSHQKETSRTILLDTVTGQHREAVPSRASVISWSRKENCSHANSFRPASQEQVEYNHEIEKRSDGRAKETQELKEALTSVPPLAELQTEPETTQLERER